MRGLKRGSKSRKKQIEMGEKVEDEEKHFSAGKFDPTTDVDKQRLHVARCYAIRSIVNSVGRSVYLCGMSGNQLRICVYIEISKNKKAK